MGAIFTVDETADYDFTSSNDATWTGSLAYLIEAQTLDGTTPDELLHERNFRQAGTICGEQDAAARVRDCTPRSLTEPGAVRLSGQLWPGTYVIQLHASGANRTDFHASVTFSSRPTRWEEFSGTTRLIVAEPTGNGTALANWTSSGPFLVAVHTAGGIGVDGLLSFSVTGPGFLGSYGGQAESSTHPVHRHFAGTAGNWSIQAQIRNSTAAPSALVVGIIEAPPYVRQDGTFIALGPGVLDGSSYTTFQFPHGSGSIVSTSVS